MLIMKRQIISDLTFRYEKNIYPISNLKKKEYLL